MQRASAQGPPPAGGPPAPPGLSPSRCPPSTARARARPRTPRAPSVPRNASPAAVPGSTGCSAAPSVAPLARSARTTPCRSPAERAGRATRVTTRSPPARTGVERVHRRVHACRKAARRDPGSAPAQALSAWIESLPQTPPSPLGAGPPSAGHRAAHGRPAASAEPGQGRPQRSDPTERVVLGGLVALEGGSTLVGAGQDRKRGFSRGQAHVLDAAAGSLLRTSDDPMPSFGDSFSRSVALGGLALIRRPGRPLEGAGRKHRPSPTPRHRHRRSDPHVRRPLAHGRRARLRSRAERRTCPDRCARRRQPRLGSGARPFCPTWPRATHRAPWTVRPRPRRTASADLSPSTGRALRSALWVTTDKASTSVRPTFSARSRATSSGPSTTPS